MAPKPWKLIQSRTERRFPIFNLRIDRACSPRTAVEHDFYVLEAADWVNVIPLTSGEVVVLIRQYRHGLRDLCLEIPGDCWKQAILPKRPLIANCLKRPVIGKQKCCPWIMFILTPPF